MYTCAHACARVLAGVVPSGDEDATEGPAQAADGEVPRRGGPRLRRHRARVALPALARDAQPLLRPLPVFARRHLHTADQPRLRHQSRTSLMHATSAAPAFACDVRARHCMTTTRFILGWREHLTLTYTDTIHVV